LAALPVAGLPAIPVAVGGEIGESTEITKVHDPTNKDRAFFKVKNKEVGLIVDFHVRVSDAKITSISSPNGWTAQGKDADGKHITQPPYSGVNWTANTPQNGIAPEGVQEEFDIVVKDDQSGDDGNEHWVSAWVTYQQAGPPPGPGQHPHSYTVYYQVRDSADGRWRTEKTRRPQSNCQAVGPAGGSVAIGIDATISVPPGAVTDETWFSCYVLPEDMASYGAPAADGARIYKAFVFGPDGRDFALPVTLTLSYASLPGIENPRAYLYDGNQCTWLPVEQAQADPQSKQIVLEATHFSAYGIGGTPPPVGGLAELPMTAWHRGGWHALGIGLGALAAVLAATWYAKRRRVA
jgi:hypothetical protein